MSASKQAEKVSREISPNDQMIYGVSVDQYIAGGKLALDLCLQALGNKVPERILDFPSGHGRVMRWLRHQWPGSDLYALEVDTDALKFCEREFGAKPIISRASIEDLELPNDVDLIWSGSLLTHFNERMWRSFLTRCVDSLRPGGVLVFTTHGRLANMLANRGDPVFGHLVNLPTLCEGYRQTGFAYQDYDPAYPVYGLSFSSPSWVARQIEPLRYAKIINFIEGGWGYQDVIALQKLPTPI
jgi:SAM-dependent methyltransferase